MTQAKAFAALSATEPLVPYSFERRSVGENDVQIEIKFCGVCHSDLHTARAEWSGVEFPVIPGHEIVGKVIGVGPRVKKFKVGDLAAVGCMVDSNCRSCPSCKSGLEQYCETGGTVFTYNSPDRNFPGKMTYGGYSNQIVVNQDFVFSISPNLDLAASAPLLCAGITTYSPLRHWKVGKGMKVGIVGLGGLGHMGVKFAHALGAQTVLFTTSPAKAEDGRRLGADEVVVSKDASAMQKHANSFDFILNTVAASHSLDPFLSLLRRDGTLCLVGAPAHPHPSPTVQMMIFGRKSLAGSLIGGTTETQAMLDFCAQNRIVSDIEIIPASAVNQAYERMLKGDVRYRFVIDCATI